MCVHAFKSAVTLTRILSYYVDIFVLIVSEDNEDEDGQSWEKIYILYTLYI